MKYLRIKRKKDITRILKTGKRAHAETVTVIYLASEQTQMAVCVGKKYGKSTQRNRIKRLLREAFRLQTERNLPYSFLLMPRVKEEYAFAAFYRDIGKILKKERLIERQHPNVAEAEQNLSAEKRI
jgi:ribonuclease P protein component